MGSITHQGTTYKNLTMHEIHIVPAGLRIPAPPSATSHPARVNMSEVVEYKGNVKFTRVEYGEIFGLPEPVNNTLYIVSAVVLNALNGSRSDCVAVSNTIRDQNGTVIGAHGFRFNG
jgi:hypothetical protein